MSKHPKSSNPRPRRIADSSPTLCLFCRRDYGYQFVCSRCIQLLLSIDAEERSRRYHDSDQREWIGGNT